MADPRNGGGGVTAIAVKSFGLMWAKIVCSSMLNQLNKSPNLSHEQHAINGGVDKYNRLKPTCDSE